jgi:hypothetical protein
MVTAKPLYSSVREEIKDENEELSTSMAENVQSRPKREYAAV